MITKSTVFEHSRYFHSNVGVVKTFTVKTYLFLDHLCFFFLVNVENEQKSKDQLLKKSQKLCCRVLLQWILVFIIWWAVKEDLDWYPK